MNNAITAQDVQEIYKRVEKSKKGTFFIDKNDKKEVETPDNHIDVNVAKYYESIASGSVDIAKLEEDGRKARVIANGFIRG
jgi:hypothetical protein